MKITKNRYLIGFASTVAILAMTRCMFPSIAQDRTEQGNQVAQAERKDSAQETGSAKEKPAAYKPGKATRFFNADGSPVKNRILSVADYSKAFPDSNNVQLEAANKHGVPPVRDRNDAEKRKNELVYIGSSPYYHIDKMHRSVPYLVPRAAVLLNDIGRAFFDSLQTKGVPLHKFIVTSVLRTKDDVQKLRNYNSNATENSCHLYGTTVDICYNRYQTVSDPEGSPRRAVRNDTLKWVLSEVLNDMRQNNRCYIKYERKQGCFHLTVR